MLKSIWKATLILRIALLNAYLSGCDFIDLRGWAEGLQSRDFAGAGKAKARHAALLWPIF
ncbi:hypothetical protein [Acinetobacter sp.]|jgi:hypothetical protein|uniref:hypothetical protein n=1 Tax=Acinetobacter sp. TaxID=472 RepID=UPI0035AEFD02